MTNTHINRPHVLKEMRSPQVRGEPVAGPYSLPANWQLGADILRVEIPGALPGISHLKEKMLIESNPQICIQIESNPQRSTYTRDK